jgi:hypothetical protein
MNEDLDIDKKILNGWPCIIARPDTFDWIKIIRRIPKDEFEYSELTIYSRTQDKYEFHYNLEGGIERGTDIWDEDQLIDFFHDFQVFGGINYWNRIATKQEKQRIDLELMK